MLAGMLISLLHAWLSITVRADQIISGTIINIFAAGLTTYLFTVVLAAYQVVPVRSGRSCRRRR